jgi:hypothetical protein
MAEMLVLALEDLLLEMVEQLLVTLVAVFLIPVQQAVRAET